MSRIVVGLLAPPAGPGTQLRVSAGLAPDFPRATILFD